MAKFQILTVFNCENVLTTVTGRDAGLITSLKKNPLWDLICEEFNIEDCRGLSLESVMDAAKLVSDASIKLDLREVEYHCR